MSHKQPKLLTLLPWRFHFLRYSLLFIILRGKKNLDLKFARSELSSKDWTWSFYTVALTWRQTEWTFSVRSLTFVSKCPLSLFCVLSQRMPLCLEAISLEVAVFYLLAEGRLQTHIHTLTLTYPPASAQTGTKQTARTRVNVFAQTDTQSHRNTSYTAYEWRHAHIYACTMLYSCLLKLNATQGAWREQSTPIKLQREAVKARQEINR